MMYTCDVLCLTPSDAVPFKNMSPLSCRVRVVCRSISLPPETQSGNNYRLSSPYPAGMKVAAHPQGAPILVRKPHTAATNRNTLWVIFVFAKNLIRNSGFRRVSRPRRPLAPRSEGHFNSGASCVLGPTRTLHESSCFRSYCFSFRFRLERLRVHTTRQYVVAARNGSTAAMVAAQRTAKTPVPTAFERPDTRVATIQFNGNDLPEPGADSTAHGTRASVPPSCLAVPSSHHRSPQRAAAADMVSAILTIVRVQETPEHCCNGVLDGDETDLDCGGSCNVSKCKADTPPRAHCMYAATRCCVCPSTDVDAELIHRGLPHVVCSAAIPVQDRRLVHKTP